MRTGMYGDRAELYDLLYSFKDYAGEAASLTALLAKEGVPRGSRLLEGGCGTGEHLRFLGASGFDLSPEMIAIARRKVPDADLWTADLASFTVTRPYDAFLCLFSAIGYLDEEALRSSARCIAAALRPGGIAVIEPWLQLEQLDVGRPSLQIYDSPDLKIARACVSELEGDVSVLRFHWLVARRGRPIEQFEEVHRLWCASPDALRSAFADAGFEARFEPEGLSGRGLLVARLLT
jgi:dTDP-3-amino-3,6-dideoxy-alpha-D-glucopyranose N,N-dimethyltransferase/dTDP-3-amino-3,4,6-trideoxy-alpha-D-glucopyranose N,N-dimethyltransferase/N-methyltransferase